MYLSTLMVEYGIWTNQLGVSHESAINRIVEQRHGSDDVRDLAELFAHHFNACVQNTLNWQIITIKWRKCEHTNVERFAAECCIDDIYDIQDCRYQCAHLERVLDEMDMQTIKFVSYFNNVGRTNMPHIYALFLLMVALKPTEVTVRDIAAQLARLIMNTCQPGVAKYLQCRDFIDSPYAFKSIHDAFASIMHIIDIWSDMEAYDFGIAADLGWLCVDALPDSHKQFLRDYTPNNKLWKLADSAQCTRGKADVYTPNF